MNIIEVLNELQQRNCEAVSRRGWQEAEYKNAYNGQACRVVCSENLDAGTLFYKVCIGGILGIEGLRCDEKDILANDWYTITDEKEWLKQQLQ